MDFNISAGIDINIYIEVLLQISGLDFYSLNAEYLYSSSKKLRTDQFYLFSLDSHVMHFYEAQSFYYVLFYYTL